MTCAEAPAGFESGPTRWKMVRMPRARRTGMTVFMAGGRLGDGKKGKGRLGGGGGPWGGGGATAGMPGGSRTSAEPHCEVTARLPCLAMVAPAAAATRAAAVEMLKV